MQDNLRNEEQALLQLIANGDEDAFARLFGLHHARIHMIAQTLTRSDPAAEELVQDVFLKIWLRRADLIHINDLESFLFIMVRNESYTAIRRVLRRREVYRRAFEGKDVSDTSSDNLIMEKDLERFLETAIRKLPPQQQQVYRLSREKGLDRYEIAELLNLSPNTVKTHLSQALRSLRAFYDDNIYSSGTIAIMVYLSLDPLL